jgi:uncharacterized protein
MKQGLAPPLGTVARTAEWARLAEFATNGAPPATLAIVWGRRRVGKSYLLSSLCEAANGFYYTAIRGSRSEALDELGALLASYSAAPARLDLPDWSTAIEVLMQLAAERAIPVVLDEYPYLREHSPELDSVLQRAFAPRSALRLGTRCRLVVCGSAISVMRGLLSGSAPLHGRAGLDMRLSPFDFRQARALHGVTDLRLAVDLYSIIGGVAAYARDMVEDDLPGRRSELDAWVARRVLSPAAPLFREVDLLLSEDPVTSSARKLNLYHATLAGVARGNHAFSRLTKYVNVSGPSLTPILNGLVDAELVERLDDPVRSNRPMYHPADPLFRFHYAVIRPHHARFTGPAVDARGVWRSVGPTFASQVVGPTFEAMVRCWASHHAAPETLGGEPGHIGTTVIESRSSPRQLDLVVAADDHREPGRRTVIAIGEAKARDRITVHHLQRLEECRAALGARAVDAKLLLAGVDFSRGLVGRVGTRSDVELVDLDRLYEGT